MPRLERLEGTGGLICCLVVLAGLVCGAISGAAAAEPRLQFALIVSGGMDGATTTKLFVYGDGLVIRQNEGKSEAAPRWSSIALDQAAHGALVTRVREALKQGRTCESGPSLIDGFAARLYEIGADDPPVAALYRLSLGNARPTRGSCAALAAAYDALSALDRRPAAVPWRPDPADRPADGQNRPLAPPGEALLNTAIPVNR